MAKVKAPKAPKDSPAREVPEAPAGKEKFLDKMGRYALYGQMFGNDSANMSMGQRIGGAAYSAFEQATLGQMGTLGKAMSAGISARGKKQGGVEGGSGIDTQEIPFQQIKGDDVVGAINQSTRQLVGGLNSVNNTLGRGFNGLNDRLQAQGQALDSIVAANEDVAIQMRELYEQLNKMAYDRGGQGGANASTLAGRPTSGGGQGGAGAAGGGLLGGLLGDVLTGAAVAGGAKVGAKVLEKTAGKTVLKSLVKKIPVVGLLFGLGFAASRLAEGDILGAAGELLSGAVSLIPGAGTAASIGIDAALAARDLENLNDEDAVEQEKEAPTPALENEKEQYAYINDPGIAGQPGDLGKPGPNHGVRVKLIKKVPSGWVVEYPNGQQAFTGENTLVSSPPPDAPPSPVTQAPNYTDDAAKLLKKQRMDEEEEQLLKDASVVEDFATKMGLSPDNVQAKTEGGVPVEINGVPVPDELYTDKQRNNIKAARDMKKMMQGGGEADLPAVGANPSSGSVSDATPVTKEPWPENWDEDFYSKFPEWMNVKDQDYPPSRLTDSPAPTRAPLRKYLEEQKNRTGLQGPDTSEQKLKEQERVAEEAQKEQSVTDVLINAKELFYKAENITFDADKIIFKYNQLGEQASSDATSASASTDTSGGAPPPPAGTQVTASTGAGGAGGVASGFARGGQDVIPGDVTGAGVVPQAPSSVTDVIKSAPTPGAGPAQAGTAAGSIPQAPVTAAIPPGGFGPAVKDGSNGKLPDSQLAPIGIGSLKAQPSAAAAFKAMRAAASADGVKLGATDGYRTFAQQVDVKRRKPNLAATPGKSNHGWGLAFDMDFGSNVNSPGYKWMVANAARFGFKGPLKKPNEPWHWEYAGGGGGAPQQPDATQVATQPGGAGEGGTPGGATGAAAPMAPAGGGGGAPSPMPGGGGEAGGGGNPLASMLGGGGSPFGMASNMLGPVIGSMSKNASLNAAAPPSGPATTNVFNNTTTPSGGGNSETINPGSPQPAVSSMFAKLFEGSAMFG